LRSFISRISGLTASMGGPGLFVSAYLDSTFVPLPLINDSLVVFAVTNHKAWMLYYVACATLGSLAGCYTLYGLAEKGGEAFLRKRLRQGHLERALASYQRHGLLAVMVPGLLPPPAPFKLFVLVAGVAGVRPLQFIVGIALSRGARFLALGILAVYYGDYALEIMRTRGQAIALWLVPIIFIALATWWAWQRRRRAVHAE
jgi:membrane protein YqaA with SNARE-associated domain